RVVIARPEPILQHDAGHAERVQPLGDGLSLMVGQPPIPSARADDDRRPIVHPGGWRVDGDRRYIRLLGPQRARHFAGRPERKCAYVQKLPPGFKMPFGSSALLIAKSGVMPRSITKAAFRVEPMP